MDNLYAALADRVDDTPALGIVIGVNWTFLESPLGSGLVQTPRRDAPGCQPISAAGDLAGQPLRQLAKFADSENPLEAVVGFAAINAFYNRYDLEGGEENGLDVFSGLDGPVTVIGRFPRLTKHLKIFHVIEREPRHGEFPESETKRLLSESEAVVITASTLVNRSLSEILDMAKDMKVALVGPGTPLAPELHDAGIDILAGTVIEDPKGAAKAVAEGGAVSALRARSRFVTLRVSNG